MGLFQPSEPSTSHPVVLHGDPKLSRRFGIYVPDGEQWCGLYDKDGGLIPEAATEWGPERHTLFAPAVTEHRPEERLDGRFVYVGAGHPHFGHWLLSSLPRFWSIARDGLDGRKILYDSVSPMQTLMQTRPLPAAVLGAMGLTADEFFWQPRPARVDDVLVPASAFNEMLECWSSFGEMCRNLSERLCPSPAPATDRMTYLSKSRLEQGVWRLDGEVRLEAELARLGVEIVHPQTLRFAEQVALFNAGRRLISARSSALHTGLFARRPVRQTVFWIDPHRHASYEMIDALTGSRPDYVWTEAQALGEGHGFTQTFRIGDPVAAARELLALAEAG